VLFGFVVERLGIDRLIRFSLLTAVAGAALFALDFSPAMSAVSLALVGLGLAAIFPCMMTRTPQRLGKALAAHAIGFQVSAAMLGAAALPSFLGLIAQRVGLNAVAHSALIMTISLFLLHEGLLLRDRHRL
jgi:MFS family permease